MVFSLAPSMPLAEVIDYRALDHGQAWGPRIDNTSKNWPGPGRGHCHSSLAAAGKGPIPQFLNLAPLEAALLPLCLMVVGDYTREYTQDSLLELLRGAGLTQAILPSAPGLQPEASRFGVAQFQVLPGLVRCVLHSPGCSPQCQLYLHPPHSRWSPLAPAGSTFRPGLIKLTRSPPLRLLRSLIG
jgi:hypothetical protein